MNKDEHSQNLSHHNSDIATDKPHPWKDAVSPHRIPFQIAIMKEIYMLDLVVHWILKHDQNHHRQHPVIPIF